MGCLADARSFRFDAAHYVGIDPPEELVQSRGWSFSKDTHGADGFIGFGNSSTSAVASFDLPCAGEKRMLDIGYLLSYRGMGAVKVVVDGYGSGPQERSTVIDGLWTTMASVQGYHVVSIPEGRSATRVTFEVLSEQTEVAYASFLSKAGNDDGSVRVDRKFKLVNMQCC